MLRLLQSALIAMTTARWALAFGNHSWKQNLNRITIRSRSYFAFDIQNKHDAESPTSIRQHLLHESLQKIQLDPILIEQANSKNMENPTTGYDVTFGRSAIRTYRSFIHPKNESDNLTPAMMAAQADRCARQIDFLRRRHLAHQTEWVRHTDSEDKLCGDQVGRFPLIMILDNVRSAFNVGSLFRTADACGVQEVITVRFCSAIVAQRGPSACPVLTSPDLFPLDRDHGTSWWIGGGETEQISIGRRKNCRHSSLRFNSRGSGCNETRIPRILNNRTGNN